MTSRSISANQNRTVSTSEWTPSDEFCRHISEILRQINLTGFACCFGIATNIINIMVFCKQRINNTINISLFALTVSDISSLTSLLWLTICLSPWFQTLDLPFVPSEIEYLTAGLPHVCFSRITCWITLYITAERFLCIFIPLKVKNIVTIKKAAFALCSIYLIIFSSVSYEYATLSFAWKEYPRRNRTMIGLIYSNNRQRFEGIAFIICAVLAVIPFSLIHFPSAQLLIFCCAISLDVSINFFSWREFLKNKRTTKEYFVSR